MSEDEGHSHGDAESDADDDGDLVSVNVTCMQCKQQLECIFIILTVITTGLLVRLLSLPRYETGEILQLVCCNCCYFVWMLPIHPGHPSPHCLAMARQKRLKTTRVCNIHIKATVWHDGMLVLQISLLHFAALCDGAVMHRQRHDTNVELSHC